MSSPFVITLIVHVLSGIVGVGVLYVMLMNIMKRLPDYPFLIKMSWSAVLLFVVSWISAAYYYVLHYGPAVKPRILAGTHPWAHNFFMETKEHVFLMLPFIAISIAVSLMYLEQNTDDSLKRAVTVLTVIAFAIGLFSALSGIFISGSI